MIYAWRTLEELSCMHEEVFNDRPEDKGGKISQRANKQHGAYEQNRKKRTRNRESAWSGGNELLASERACQCHYRDDHRKAPKEHREPERRVIPWSVRAQAGEGASIVTSGRAVSVEDLGKTMRAAVVCPVAQ